jgi:hypothetical protein
MGTDRVDGGRGCAHRRQLQGNHHRPRHRPPTPICANCGSFRCYRPPSLWQPFELGTRSCAGALGCSSIRAGAPSIPPAPSAVGASAPAALYRPLAASASAPSTVAASAQAPSTSHRRPRPSQHPLRPPSHSIRAGALGSRSIRAGALGRRSICADALGSHSIRPAPAPPAA